MAANPQYAAGEVIANKYVVEALLGESPAARTFLANGNAGKLAVKFYRPEVSSRLLAAPDFFLKAGVMTEIEHDNLSACVDVQEEMGLVFVARAYSEGESFEEWIRKHRGEGNYYSRGLELLWQICQGLATLHERTRHLDIHPGNVMVGPLVARLCDWDPRALGNTELTPDTLPIRSEYQGYRAPEASGRNGFLSYPSTDLFAVAGLLYRLVKGEHPSVNPAQTLGEARALEKDLAVFLGKAMHPKPEERFQDAGTFSDALWELQASMARLQERIARSTPPQPKAGSAPDFQPVRQEQAAPPPRKIEPKFAVPPPPPVGRDMLADGPGGTDAAFFGAPKPAGGNDTFFNFFPPVDTAPPGRNPSSDLNGFPAPETKPAGDTLFGAPPIASQRQSPSPPHRETHDFDFGSQPNFPAPSQSDLRNLETPGTLFGSQQPLFSARAQPAPWSEPPPPAKPLAVSLSSLEKDPLEMAGNGEPEGFTAYGFKGAGDRTGIYSPEAQAAAAKTKLRILLGTAGILILLLGLGGLFLFLRSNAAQNGAVVAGPPPEAIAADPEQTPRPDPAPIDPKSQPEFSSPPFPDAEPVALPPERAPKAQADPSGNAYLEPPMPVEPQRPDASEEIQQASPAKQPSPTAYSPTAYRGANKGNGHISPEREAALMGMVQTRAWPNSASECLNAADDLNDLGKTAEANTAYSKALIAGDVNERQKILAYGGLAVTFQTMGLREQARDAVSQILAINPRNGFALKMKEKLK